jgi:hypothetical protein
MTSRLLHLTFGGGSYDAQREAMRRRRRGTSYDVGGGGKVVVGSIPLIRRGSDGDEQAVRIDNDTARPVDVALRRGEQAAENFVLPGSHADIWVPAVESATTYELVIDGSSYGGIDVEPQRRWTVHVVHHSHLDIGYTDPQGVVLRHHLDYLDDTLTLATATDRRTDDAQFRWTVESSFAAERWLSLRPREQVDEFVRRVRERRIEVTALPFQLHTEACSTDELWRQARSALRLGERLGVPIDSAMHTDVPGAVAGLVDALSEAGVRYLSAAHNWAGRSVPYLHDGELLERPFWWLAPSGKRVLTWFTDSAHGMAYMEGNLVGLADDVETCTRLLPSYLDCLAVRDAPFGPEAFGWNGHPDDAADTRPAYGYDVLHLRVQGARADNAGPSASVSDLVTAWNEQYVSPRLRCSTNRDFFVDIEAKYGDELAEHSGDWGDWWADGLGSGARELGWARRAQSALRTAETLHAWADARTGVDESPVASIDDAYTKLALFDEHTWGAANPWEDAEEGFSSGGRQWTWKAALAQDGHDAAMDLLQSGTHRMAASLGTSSDGRDIAVVNTSSVECTDLATVFVPMAVVPFSEEVLVVDCRTGEKVATECTRRDPVATPTRPGGRELRFLARDVPAMGVAAFRLEPGVPVEPTALTVDNGTVTLTGEHFTVTVDMATGTLSSVRHNGSGRDLVAQDSVARMNDYVHELYATAPHINHMSGHLAAKDVELLARRAVGGAAVVVEAVRTATVDRVVLDRRAPGATSLLTTVEVPHGVDRVLITNTLTRDGTDAKEGVYFAFPVDARGPASWELTGAVGGDAVPHVPGGAHHLLCLRHWLAFETPGLTIAWATAEAPLVQRGALHVPYAPFPRSVDPSPPEPGLVFSWAMNNIWDTNFPGRQGGEVTFRYALSASTDAPASVVGATAAAAFTDPLTTLLGASAGDSAASVVSCSDAEVQVMSLGRAVGSPGLVVRLRSFARETRAVELRLAAPATEVRVGNGHELHQQPVPVIDGIVEVTVPAMGLATVVVN